MTPNKEKASAALLTHATKKEAATAANIDPRTMRRYFDDEDFQQAYKKAFSGMVEDAVRQSQQALAPALATLREICEDGDPWIGGDRTLKVTYYANGNEDDLANNSQQFFEQVGLGIVLAHVPDFVDKTVRFSMTLQSFHKDYPQYAALADKVSAVLRDMVSGE